MTGARAVLRAAALYAATLASTSTSSAGVAAAPEDP